MLSPTMTEGRSIKKIIQINGSLELRSSFSPVIVLSYLSALISNLYTKPKADYSIQCLAHLP